MINKSLQNAQVWENNQHERKKKLNYRNGLSVIPCRYFIKYMILASWVMLGNKFNSIHHQEIVGSKPNVV